MRSSITILASIAGLSLSTVGSAGASNLSIDDILAFFDNSMEVGTLVGEGPGKSGRHRQEALRNMLASAGNLLDQGADDDACDQLFDAFERTDDRFPPPDFVSGDAAVGLSDLILTLRIEIGCDIAILAPGEGVTIEGPGGLSVTVPVGAVPFESFIGIGPARSSAVKADNGNLPFLTTVEFIFGPTAFNSSVLPPTAPLVITAPAPAGTAPGEKFVVGLQVLSDHVGGSSPPGLLEQFVVVASGQEEGGQLVTTSDVFPGVFAGGVISFLSATGSGFATGTVSDASGARAGAVVSNNTNTLVSISNGSGQYTLFISGGPFSVTGFDPFRGSSGSTLGNITTDGATVTANIALSPLAVPPITRDGIRNGGFERGDTSSWGTIGATLARQQLVCTGATIRPTEGQWMGDVNTGAGSVGSTGSAITQSFTVPAGVSTMRVDFNYVSEEFPEFVGSIFNDSFLAVITTPNGQSTFKKVTVNNSGGFQLIGDCGFPGGDNTSGMTGWRTASVDVSGFAGTGTPIQVQLLFSANDAGDDIFDTHVLLDNMRFSTLWIDAKILTGPTIAANANANRVRTEVRAANEILSQAGMNLRIRNIRTANTTDALVDTDITWTFGPGCAGGTVNGILTAEETAVLGILRSATNTDLNVYYVRSGTGLAGVGGFALGPDDFCVGVNILTNSGTFQMDIGGGGNTLAHEVGHIVISPQTAGNVIEHLAAAGNFLSTTPALGVVNRAQSANINRAGAPLLVP